MNKILLGIGVAFALALATITMSPAQEAYACYQGGFSDGSFGPGNFSLEWSNEGEAFAAASLVQQHDERLAKEYKANRSLYEAVYASIFTRIAQGHMLNEGSTDGDPVQATTWDAEVRTTYILWHLVLLLFERCDPRV